MRLRLSRSLIAVCIIGCGFIQAWGDEAEIRAFVRGYADAFNEKKLDAVATMWTENAVHEDRVSGEHTEGREAIRNDLALVFGAASSTRIAGEVQSVRFATPEVATVRGTIVTSVADQEPEMSQYSAVIVKNNGAWQIDSVEESQFSAAAGPRVALSELEWLVGDWLDSSGDSQIISSIRWSENETFLVRTIARQDVDGAVSRVGTQIIGWDPRALQIRSWNFNADGSFGDGVWSKSGEDWMVKSSQTLAGGEASSGTYVITVIDPDSISMRLIGHEIEGEPIPASEAVTLVRLAKSGPDETAANAGTSVSAEPSTN